MASSSAPAAGPGEVPSRRISGKRAPLSVLTGPLVKRWRQGILSCEDAASVQEPAQEEEEPAGEEAGNVLQNLIRKQASRRRSATASTLLLQRAEPAAIAIEAQRKAICLSKTAGSKKGKSSSHPESKLTMELDTAPDVPTKECSKDRMVLLEANLPVSKNAIVARLAGQEFEDCATRFNLAAFVLRAEYDSEAHAPATISRSERLKPTDWPLLGAATKVAAKHIANRVSQIQKRRSFVKALGLHKDILDAPKEFIEGTLGESSSRNEMEESLSIEGPAFGKLLNEHCMIQSGTEHEPKSKKKSELGANLKNAKWTSFSQSQMDQLKKGKSSMLRDYMRCHEASKGFDAVLKGTYVAPFFGAGYFLSQPWTLRSGLSVYHCRKCGFWVKRHCEEEHAIHCNRDRRSTPTVFKQFVGDDMGMLLRFRHDVKKLKVNVTLSAPLVAIARRAEWACFWTPDHTEVDWRVVSTPGSGGSFNTRPPQPEVGPSSGSVDNTLQQNILRPGEKWLRKEKGSHKKAYAKAYIKPGKVICDSSNSEEEDSDDPGSEFDAPGFFPPGGVVQHLIDSADEDELFLSDDDSEDGEGGASKRRRAGRFFLRNSYDVAKADQPAEIRLDLKPEQLHTLGWMLQREGRRGKSEGYVSTQVIERRVAETDVCFQLRLRRNFRHARGGICGDSMGYGKTACMIALIASGMQHRMRDDLFDQEKELLRSRILTDATLVITPPNLFDQWQREIEKFVHPDVGLRVLVVPSHGKLKSLKVKDFLEADIVLVSFRMFFSEAYRTYFDEATNPCLKGNLWDAKGLQQIHEAKERQKTMKKVSEAGGSKAAAAIPMKKVFAPYSMLRSDCEQQGYTRCPVAGRYFIMRPDTSIPSKKVSSNYKVVQESESYGARRYAYLSEHVQKLLSKSADEVAAAPAFLEMFYWKRVCFDEFHEVVRAKSCNGNSAASRRATLYALHSLAGRCAWGLTGTPLMNSSEAVADMASLLRTFIPPGDKVEAQRWLDGWARSNTWDRRSIATEEHVVTVTLTPAERALYVSQRNVLQGARSEDGMTARHAEQRLLMLCSHFDPDKGEAEDAGFAVLQTQQKQRALLLRAEQGVQECEAQLGDLRLRDDARAVLGGLCKQLPHDELVFAHLQPDALLLLQSRAEGILKIQADRRAAEDADSQHGAGADRKEHKEVIPDTKVAVQELRQTIASLGPLIRELSLKQDFPSMQKAEEGNFMLCPNGFNNFKKKSGVCLTCKSMQDATESIHTLNRSKGMHESKRKEMESQIRFLESTLRGLDGQSFECSFCLEQTDPSGSDAAVLTCGHAFHQECAIQALASSPMCPLCRHPATAQQATNLKELFAAPAEKEKSGPAAELARRCGSKNAAIVQTIRDIQKVEGGPGSEKCVVFIQWDVLMHHLARTLASAGHTPLVLQGGTSQRTQILRRFIDDPGEDSSILLLSLEQSPSGMNLVCARNVLLVHPMHARSREEAINFERQAIGRAVRQGQKRKVRIYRFVTKDTVEEEISQRHHAEIFKALSAEGQEESLRADADASSKRPDKGPLEDFDMIDAEEAELVGGGSSGSGFGAVLGGGSSSSSSGAGMRPESA